MQQSAIQKLNDLRQRILRADELIRAGEEVPPGLEPSDEELREALELLRAARIEQLNAAKPAGPRPVDELLAMLDAKGGGTTS